MADPQCALCPRPAPDAPVCTGCATHELDQALRTGSAEALDWAAKYLHDLGEHLVANNIKNTADNVRDGYSSVAITTAEDLLARRLPLHVRPELPIPTSGTAGPHQPHHQQPHSSQRHTHHQHIPQPADGNTQRPRRRHQPDQQHPHSVTPTNPPHHPQVG